MVQSQLFGMIWLDFAVFHLWLGFSGRAKQRNLSGFEFPLYLVFESGRSDWLDLNHTPILGLVSHLQTMQNQNRGESCSSLEDEERVNAGEHDSVSSRGYIWMIRVHKCSRLMAQLVYNLPAVRETSIRSLGWEDPLEKGMATHSSILAWRIPWTEEPGVLRSMGWQRVGRDWLSNSHFH